MIASLADVDADLLLALQSGLPLEPRPFTGIAAQVGLTEGEVLARVARFAREGLVRRLGGVFDSRSLGYESTLCAADVPAADLESIARRLHPHPGVTHCYQRDGAPSLWFTMTAPAADFARAIETMVRQVAPYELMNLPTRRTFKIGVILDVRRPTRSGADRATAPERKPVASKAGRIFSGQERALIRLLQKDLPLVPEPFAAIATQANLDQDAVLICLREWQQQGILRRVGLVPYHRELGFAFNGMCLWQVDSRRIEDAGRTVAAAPEVTHCYERVLHPKFPFNLFAMIHAGNPMEAQQVSGRISAAAGLPDARILASVREFKKTSPIFFD